MLVRDYYDSLSRSVFSLLGRNRDRRTNEYRPDTLEKLGHLL
jgi:hypothetical protein